jgi:hypothetical protein
MSEEASKLSALQDNIERKGKNAYYHAHATKINGPQWDGKAEPRFLGRTDSTQGLSHATFDIHKSNLSKYAFMDEKLKVKVYLDLELIGEKCTEDDIQLDFTDMSFCLVINNYKDEPQCLSFARLTAKITNATYRLKKDKLIVTLIKASEGEWHTINDKGTPDHEVV